MSLSSRRSWNPCSRAWTIGQPFRNFLGIHLPRLHYLMIGLCAAMLIVMTAGCYQTEYIYRDRKVLVRDPVPSEYSRCRLTLELIEELDLTAQELSKLKYYLGNAVLLQRVSAKQSWSITSEGAIDVNRIVKQDEAVIEHMAIGYVKSPSNVWMERQWLGLRGVYKIRVCFNGNGNDCLVFAPNFWGEYVVEKEFWTEQVAYKSKWYYSIRTDRESYLLVESRTLEEIRHTRHVIKGVNAKP